MVRNENEPIPIIDGDIFECNDDAILHQVNCQGVMGSGVAKQVRERYPYVYKQYRQLCENAIEEGISLLGTIQKCFKTDSCKSKF